MTKNSSGKKNTDKITRDDLENHVNAFLKKGGEIQQIPSGETGFQPNKGPRHIVIQSSSNK